MVVSAAYRPELDASAAVNPPPDYFTTGAHYVSVAGRICGALRDARIVLVAGDPLLDAHCLSDALRAAAQSQRAVIEVPCGPELTADALLRAGPQPAAMDETPATPATSEPAPPLFEIGRAHV